MSHNHSNDTSSEKSLTNHSYPLAYIVSLCLLSTLIFLINSVVIYLFATRDILRTETNRILVSLAFSDMINSVFTIPLQITCNVYDEERSLRLTSMVLYRFVAASTMFHILAVTLERHIFVVFPLRYKSLVTKRRVIMTACVIWLTSAIYAVIGLSWLYLADDYNHLEHPPGLDNSRIMRIEFSYTIAGFLLCFLIPLVIMSYSFTTILREISRLNRRQSELMPHVCLEPLEERQRFLLDRKPVLIFMVMLLLFVLSWSSWYVQLLILAVAPQRYKPLGVTFDFLRYVTSLTNPLLYSLVKKDFRQVLRKCLLNTKAQVFIRRKSTTDKKSTLRSFNTEDNV